MVKTGRHHENTAFWWN